MIAASAIVAVAAVFVAAMPSGDPISHEGNTTIVNTQNLGKSVRGFRGPTPVKIYIQKNKVVKIETLGNHETPQYFAKAKTLLKKYSGKSVKSASAMEVDGVSGATWSSKALKKNVQLGLNYYNSHK